MLSKLTKLDWSNEIYVVLLFAKNEYKDAPYPSEDAVSLKDTIIASNSSGEYKPGI